MAIPALLRRPLFWIVALLAAGLGVGGYLWWRRSQAPELPQPGTPLYQEYVEAFQVGVAALDADRYDIANRKLTLAIEKIPEEPAAWADRGLLHLRNHEPKEAARDLKRAQELAPDSSAVEILLGLVAEQQGRFSQAVRHLRRAVQRRPHDLAARFTLQKLIAREGNPDSDRESQRLLEEILRVQPTNLFVLKELAGVVLRRGDAAAFRNVLARFRKLAPAWSRQTRDLLDRLARAAARSLRGETVILLAQFSNSLQREAGFTRSAQAVNPGEKQMGQAIYRFLRLQAPTSSPAAPDLELAFTTRPVAGAVAARLGGARWDVVQAMWLTGGRQPAVFVANGREVRRADADAPVQAFPGGDRKVPPTAHGVLALDWNNDFRTDLLLAGAGGLRFLQQESNGTFTDVTARTGLDPAVLEGDYHGAWAADVEMDGDLDIILAPRKGPPLLLQNNRDGTFKALRPFPGVDGLRDFVWADLDNDGAPDAAMLDARGRLHVFANERSLQFRARTVPDRLGKLLALAVADVNDEGVLDLVALRADGQVVRISDKDQGQGWEVGEVVRWADLPTPLVAGSVRLLIADLDNNGGLDLVGSGPQGGHVWLSDSRGKFQPLPAALTQPVFAAAELTNNGRVDLLALSGEGQPVRLTSRGVKDYSWQVVLPRATRKEKVTGDNRINSFGIGSEVEVRTGTLVQKQMTAAPVVHFGLGRQKRADVLRILWPNGTVQVEFEAQPNRVVVAEQRLKGSCPFLFAYDGKGMRFVTDFMWSTPLGMYINAQDKGGFLQTTDWVKVRGDQLVPRDGYYDVRVTANLWESHYYDYMALIVVDHPPGTEMFVDERFAVAPLVPQVYLTGPPRPVARARDERGQDVTDLVRAIDGRYLDTFERGPFQGVAREHWVEVDLGADASQEGPLWLLAHGWVHPTDSSINFALAQGRHEPPRALVLDVPDGRGGWKVGRNDLGFPAGKNKTLMVRLDGIAGRGVPRRFRLRTNMEVFWDQLAWARGLDAGLARQQRLSPYRAELRYLGFLETTQADSSSPELPHYDKLVGKTQRWRDLIGYYTRFGDVRELLAAIDDRYVIMNAGDEIAMRFRVPTGPPKGWKRDFVWVCDGWAKDGDLNTRFSKTVIPLPAHDLKTYDTPPGRLEDDPVHRRFPQDWQKYHTRYVAPDVFNQGLRSFRRP
jgi:tetratricopeptide (TPR) repeat protein